MNTWNRQMTSANMSKALWCVCVWNKRCQVIECWKVKRSKMCIRECWKGELCELNINRFCRYRLGFKHPIFCFVFVCSGSETRTKLKYISMKYMFLNRCILHLRKWPISVLHYVLLWQLNCALWADKPLHSWFLKIALRSTVKTGYWHRVQ